jgi:hypothetical protein
MHLTPMISIDLVFFDSQLFSPLKSPENSPREQERRSEKNQFWQAVSKLLHVAQDEPEVSNHHDCFAVEDEQSAIAEAFATMKAHPDERYREVFYAESLEEEKAAKVESKPLPSPRRPPSASKALLQAVQHKEPIQEPVK